MIPHDLQKEIKDFKLKFKKRGYKIKNIEIEQIDFDFWELFYSEYGNKMKKEDQTPFNFDSDTRALF